MRSRSYRYLAALALLPLAASCVQATRHSNTMVFGTSTSVALKVGQGANQVPQVLIGYDRQEAVVMPLLANTRERSGVEALLSPCEPVVKRETVHQGNSVTIKETMVESGEPDIHPCKFLGIRGKDGDLQIQDSYSVLASFGAQIEGDASQTKGSVGLAQYFATGVAAQILAATGGASVVAVGEAAEESAGNPNNANAAAAVLGSDYAAPIIKRETELLQIIDAPWKCGDPGADKENYDRIIADAEENRAQGFWDRMKTAKTIKDAREFSRTLIIQDLEQLVTSLKTVCGE